MNEERIERLLERYFAAETTDAEEQELRDWFRHAEQVPEALRYAQMIFGGMDVLAGERLPEQTAGVTPVEAEAPDTAASEKSAPGTELGRGRRLFWQWGVSAAAVLALGVSLYVGLGRKPYCYIDGVAIYDQQIAMQTTVYLEAFEDFADPERMVDDLIKNE